MSTFLFLILILTRFGTLEFDLGRLHAMYRLCDPICIEFLIKRERVNQNAIAIRNDF